MGVKTITNRNPVFLKAAYACPSVDLVNHEGEIETDEKFIQWNKDWMVYRMNRNRVPIPCGRFQNLHAAINRAMQ